MKKLILAVLATLFVSSNAFASIYTLSEVFDFPPVVIDQYDENTNEYIKTLESPVNNVRFGFLFAGPDNYLYAATKDYSPGGALTRYDLLTGNFVDFFTYGSYVSTYMKFGPDGNIYALSSYATYNMGSHLNTSYIHKIDGRTGTLLDIDFISYDYGNNDEGLASFDFGPDNNIYVGRSDNILKFSGVDGHAMGEFANGGAENIVLGPDENFYGIYNDKVYKYDGQTGESLGVFAETGSTFMEFGPDGDLYVADGSSSIDIYDGKTGTLKDGIYLSGNGGMGSCNSFAFGPVAPEPVSSILMMLGGGLIVFRRRLSRSKNSGH